MYGPREKLADQLDDALSVGGCQGLLLPLGQFRFQAIRLCMKRLHINHHLGALLFCLKAPDLQLLGACSLIRQVLLCCKRSTLCVMRCFIRFLCLFLHMPRTMVKPNPLYTPRP